MTLKIAKVMSTILKCVYQMTFIQYYHIPINYNYKARTLDELRIKYQGPI